MSETERIQNNNTVSVNVTTYKRNLRFWYENSKERRKRNGDLAIKILIYEAGRGVDVQYVTTRRHVSYTSCRVDESLWQEQSLLALPLTARNSIEQHIIKT